jgi:mono/diheme cytochrome c family protein
MSKKTFIWFGVLVVVLAVLIPWLAFRSDGDEVEAASVPAGLEQGKDLFVTNCGGCHTLYAAGTDGNFGPDLDELLAPAGPLEGSAVKPAEGRVLSAIENGVDGSTTAGRMPAEIISDEQADEVSEFVAATAGQG